MRSLEVIKTLHHQPARCFSVFWQIGGFLVIAMELADKTLRITSMKLSHRACLAFRTRNYWDCAESSAKGIDYLNQPNVRTGDSTKSAIRHRDVEPQTSC